MGIEERERCVWRRVLFLQGIEGACGLFKRRAEIGEQERRRGRQENKRRGEWKTGTGTGTGKQEENREDRRIG
jgi:hypothetical protein